MSDQVQVNAECPVWLRDELELLALLTKVLDRFDHQSGETRQRALMLSLDQHLPSLARTDASADQSWSLLKELQQRGVLSIRPGKRSVYDPEWQGAKVAFAPESEDVLRDWLGRPPTERAMAIWRRALQSHAPAFPHGTHVLDSRRLVIAGRTSEEVVAALASIGAITGPVTLRQLSAHVFWGDSKVLDERQDLIADLFPQLEIQDRAIVIAVFLPASPKGVLFIENQDTYAAATRGYPPGTDGLALVYASGFRGAAARIRTPNGALLHYAGLGATAHRADFEQWWFQHVPAPGPLWFWGDLDFAGMQILKSLRTRFAELTAWKPGYDVMLQALRNRGGHALVDSPEQNQTDPGNTGCHYADETLLPAIREYGQVDQEGVAAT